MADQWDVVILGAGPAGYTAALRGTELGARVALIEREHVGGLCLNRGCIPSKALLTTAHLFFRLKGAAELGLSVQEYVAEFDRSWEHAQRTVLQLRQGLQGLLEQQKVAIHHGRGRLVDKDTVLIEGEDGTHELRGRAVLLCPGSLPAPPPIPGIESPQVITTDGAFQLKARPARLLIVGGGASGVEFADVFAAQGTQVVLLEVMPNLLPNEDVEIGRGLRRVLEARGVRVITNARVQALASEGGQATAVVSTEGREERIAADLVLLAAGRAPALEGLGFTELGGRLQGRGIAVDAQMRTNLANVYAAGDVLGGRYMLAHAGFAEGTVAVENALGRESAFDGRTVPRCIYTAPEVAAVGLTEQEARAEGRTVLVGRSFFRANGRAVTQDEAEGFVKLVADARYGEVLGVHIFGPSASEYIGLGVLALQLEATVEDLQRAILPHPTLAEAVVEAAQRVR
jgi:dihydrolipoamide dehydrogenase